MACMDYMYPGQLSPKRLLNLITHSLTECGDQNLDIGEYFSISAICTFMGQVMHI